MTSERNHPDIAELAELIGRGCVTHSVHEHMLSCVACTRALDELVQIAVVLFEDQPCSGLSEELRARTLAAAGFRPPKSRQAHGRAGSAVRAGSG